MRGDRLPASIRPEHISDDLRHTNLVLKTLDSLIQRMRVNIAPTIEKFPSHLKVKMKFDAYLFVIYQIISVFYNFISNIS